MTNVVDLGWVPVGYRVASTDADAKIECERGCGWRFRVATLTQLPADAREQLFRFHDDWHTKRGAARADSDLDEALEESFPASDAPGWTPVVGGKTKATS